MIILNHTGVGGEADLTISKGIQSRHGLFRRYSGGQMDHNLHKLCGVILDFGNFNFTLIVCSKYRVDQACSGRAKRNLHNFKQVFFYHFNFRTYSDTTASCPPVVSSTISHTSLWEVG